MGIKICKHKRFHKNAVMKEDISRKNRSKFENCDESSYIFVQLRMHVYKHRNKLDNNIYDVNAEFGTYSNVSLVQVR